MKTEQFSCAPFHHAGDGKKEREGEKERGPQLTFVKISAQTNFYQLTILSSISFVCVSDCLVGVTQTFQHYKVL